MIDIQEFAREVEDAADCYSWGPSVLRKWLQTRTSLGVFEHGLGELADGRSVAYAQQAMRKSASPQLDDLRLYDVALQLVHDGATPNAIRAHLREAAEPNLLARREAA